ncbi:hypothetical protein [[Mycobacterium] burgundiense]|uniref:Lipoprotein n=1 Tax=[Mycobacterium] burgundiense TaxID=3064286 RepID=A0ABM9M5U4_9MYCO|nr:hypothetical protein [Mycolicibacterium sp. MU0053]CAJ1510516.1 hypothetical protein MU0053_004650 [Mycolicibacterium sp. MU0053]
MRSKQTVGLAATLALVGWCASAAIAVAEPEPAPAPPPGPVTTFEGDGTYAVGTEITPGTYSSAGPVEGGGACYWKRVSNGKLVDNAMSKKAQVVKIEAGDTSFKTSDCQQWNKINDCLPGCGPQGANPAAILGQLGQIVLGNPGGPPPASPAAPAAPAAEAAPAAPAGTGPAPGPAEAAS